MNKSLASGFAIAGLISWFAPGFNGYFATPSTVSAGEGHILGAIFLVGAGIIWFLHQGPKNGNR